MRGIRIAMAVILSSAASLQAGLDAPVVESPEVLQRAAAVGDGVAQYKLGRAYLDGSTLPRDPAKAAEWLRKAATAGVAPAQFALGVLLASGKELPQNDKEAAAWFAAAAKNGVFEAQVALIQCLSTGRGVAKSPAVALWWDMIARRTLQLRTAVPAGLPAKPGAVRADGAAEVTDKNGKKVWMLPDGSAVEDDNSGVRHITHKNGAKTTVQRDGSWETEYPNGTSQAVTSAGRQSFTDDMGHTETYEVDGTRTLEGIARTEKGEWVKVKDTFDREGKRISHRVKSRESTYEERADGSKFVETEVKSDTGVAMILSEPLDDEGKPSKGKLRRADNDAGPKGSEIWAIRRKLHLQGGIIAEVVEKYSEFGLYSQEIVNQYREPKSTAVVVQTIPGSMVIPRGLAMPSPTPYTRTMTAPTSMPLPPNTIGQIIVSNLGHEDPNAFAPKPDLAPMLAILAKAEVEARNFAGATEADYQRAVVGSAAYLIPLTVAPQNATATPAWLREKTISQATLHEEQLLPITDDRSSKVPLGAYGSEIIKRMAWKHAETQHFIVHYMGEAEAKLTTQYIEGVFTVLTQLLNLDPAKGSTKSHVFIFPEGEWRDFTKTKGLPPQVEGFAYKTELLLGASANRADRAEATKVICHEVTHALVSRFYPGVRAPLWLNEGLAEYIALRTMRSKGITIAAKTREESISSGDRDRTRASNELRLIGRPDKQIEVEKLFTRIAYGEATSPDRLSAFYANSQKSVQTLFEKLPLDGFPKFFNLIIAGNEPGISLATAYGKQCDGVAAFAAIVNAQ